MKTNNDVKQIQLVKIDDLVPAEYNPRKLSDKQKEDLKASLEEFGFDIPVAVNQHKDRKNVIIGGHQRALVAKEMGYEEIPAIFFNLNLEQEKQFNIRLNKNGGEFDFEKLDEFFDKDKLVDWGFEEWELDTEWNELDPVEEAEEPSLEKDVVLKILIKKEYSEIEEELKSKIQDVLKGYNGASLQ